MWGKLCTVFFSNYRGQYIQSDEAAPLTLWDTLYNIKISAIDTGQTVLSIKRKAVGLNEDPVHDSLSVIKAALQPLRSSENTDALIKTGTLKHVQCLNLH